jgi:CRISPR-associated Cas5-like protein
LPCKEDTKTKRKAGIRDEVNRIGVRTERWLGEFSPGLPPPAKKPVLFTLAFGFAAFGFHIFAHTSRHTLHLLTPSMIIGD